MANIEWSCKKTTMKHTKRTGYILVFCLFLWLCPEGLKRRTSDSWSFIQVATAEKSFLKFTVGCQTGIQMEQLVCLQKWKPTFSLGLIPTNLVGIKKASDLWSWIYWTKRISITFPAFPFSVKPLRADWRRRLKYNSREAHTDCWLTRGLQLEEATRSRSAERN